jgi:hypothetical protein
MVRARSLSPRVAFACVALVGALLLTALHHGTSARIGATQAQRAVLRDPAAVHLLAGAHITSVQVTPIDARLTRVTFLAGGRWVAEFALDAHRRVVDSTNFAIRRVPYGNWLAYEPALLAGLTALFVLCTAVTPWRRVRNLDVLAVCSLLAPMILLQRRYVQASVISATPALLYLLARCAWVSLGARRPGAPACTLADALTRRFPDARLSRLVGFAAAALALVYVMVSATTTAPVDVVYAVMEGATGLLHGVLPYGHLPGDVMHGDTYPPLSYLLYVPLAALAPVGSVWDSVDIALGATAAMAVAVAVALGWSRAGSSPGAAAGAAGGPIALARPQAALAWLAFPTLLMTTSTGTTDLALAGLLLAAICLWRRPVAACAVIAAAGWFKLAPFLLLPLWLAPLRGRQLVRALVAVGAVCAAVFGMVLALGGVGGLAQMIHAIGYQFSRGSTQSFPAALDLSALQPIGQALVLGVVAAATVAIARNPSAFDARRMSALTAVLLIGLQLSANYWSVLYLAWLAPVLMTSLLGATDPVQVPARVASASNRPRPALAPAR